MAIITAMPLRMRLSGLRRLRRARRFATAAAAPRPSAPSPPPEVHPSAVVSPSAELAPGVVVGPHCTVGPGVRLLRGAWLGSHAVVEGRTTVGERCQIHSFACVGGEPQDKKHGRGTRGRSEVVLAAECVVREHATIHAGTPAGGGVTTVGRGTLAMAGSHVGHDCRVGAGVVLANGVGLAGHVTVQDGAIIGGLSGVKQYVTVGELAMVGGGSMVDADVPPFLVASGNRAFLRGVNIVGLRRLGTGACSREDIRMLLRAFRYVFPASSCAEEGARGEADEEVGGDDGRGGARRPFAPPLHLPWRPTVVERATLAHAAMCGSGGGDGGSGGSDGGDGGNEGDGDYGNNGVRGGAMVWERFFDFVLKEDRRRGCGARPMPLCVVR